MAAEIPVLKASRDVATVRYSGSSNSPGVDFCTGLSFLSARKGLTAEMQY